MIEFADADHIYAGHVEHDGLRYIVMAAADFGARKVFNKSLKVMCDETDEMDRPLTQEAFDTLVVSGKMFEAGRGPAPTDGDDAASVPHPSLSV